MNETLTKKRIYLESVKHVLATMSLVLIFIATLVIIGFTIGGFIDGWGFFSTILRLLGVLSVSIGPIILKCVITALPTIFLIKKQERHFGFNFNEEMKKNNIKSIDCPNNEWLILEIFQGYLHVVNYNYIESFTIEEGRSRSDIGPADKDVFIESVDGKGFKMALCDKDAKKFRTWFNLER